MNGQLCRLIQTPWRKGSQSRKSMVGSRKTTISQRSSTSTERPAARPPASAGATARACATWLRVVRAISASGVSARLQRLVDLVGVSVQLLLDRGPLQHLLAVRRQEVVLEIDRARMAGPHA